MKNKELGLIVLGFAAIMLLQKKQHNAYPNYPQIPPQPPRNNAAAWQQWAQTIMQIYGTTSELFKPGGPFYQVPKSALQQAVDAPVSTYNDPYNYNPYGDYGGGVEVLV